MFRNLCQVWKFRPNSNVSILFPNKKFEVQHSFLRHCSSQLHIIQMRGLDYETKEEDVIEFFKPLGITPKAVYLKCDASGRTSAVSEVEFSTHAEAVVSMRKRNAFMGNRFIRLALKSSDTSMDLKKVPEDKGDNQAALSKNEVNVSDCMDRTPLTSGHTVKMKNAPWRLTDQAIYEFFANVGVIPISVKPFYNESGVRSGEFEVHFLTKEDAFRAMVKNNAYIGKKYVELSLQQS